MINLKSDFNNRFQTNSKEIFSTISGKSYSNHICEFYFFYIYKKIKDEKVILLCNSTLESHILSFFLILSPLKCFFISENFDFNELEIIIKDNDINSFIYFKNSNKDYSKITNTINSIEALDIDHFIKDTHPSFNKIDIQENFYVIKEIGDSVFLSSGSTGSPKLIPLSFNQINSCYKNVLSGFLDSISFNKVISLHDTSFVIILPFLFAFSFNKESKFHASDGSIKLTPILQLASNVKSIADSNSLIISVPSIYRMLIKILSDKSKFLFNKNNFITCGEPLDKSLALNIFCLSPNTFFNLYGSTEVSPWIIFLDVIKFIKSKKVFNSPLLPAGKALPNVLLKISKSKELLVSADSVFSGYLNLDNNSVFSEVALNTFFRTGDNFELIDGFFYCKGRINNSLKIGGVFINPMILEAKIKDDLNFEYLLVIPDPIKLKIFILFFSNKNQFKITSSIEIKVKDIIHKNISAKIPLILKENSKPILFLPSGKIDRKAYIKEIIND